MQSRKKTVKYLSVLLIGGAMLLSGALLTQTSLAQYGEQGSDVQTLEGVISDSKCGASHSGRDSVQCTMGCLKNGSTYVLVVGDKVYKLDGNLGSGMNNVAGKGARVTGKVDGDTILVTRGGIQPVS